MKTKGLLKKRKSQKAPNQEIVEDKDQVAVVEDESIKQNKEATDNKEKGSEEELKDKEETVTNPDFFSIFLSGLPYTCQEEQIREFLRECGEIKSILLPKYQDTGRCRGYAHVEFKKKKGLLKVREDYKKKGLALNGQKIGDRYIDISQSKGKAAVKESEK